jgi:hypothetical protein
MGIPVKSIEKIHLEKRDDGLFDVSVKAWFTDSDGIYLGTIKGVSEIRGNIKLGQPTEISGSMTLVRDPSREDNVIWTVELEDNDEDSREGKQQ